MKSLTLAATLLGKEVRAKIEMGPLKAQLEKTQAELEGARVESACW